MSAARAIPPMEETVHPISITYANSVLTLSPAGLIIASGDQVSFANDSAASGPSISIGFNPNPPPNGPVLFGAINNLQPGNTSPSQTANSAGSVNYNVTVAGVSEPFGPYVIQVGTGAQSAMVVQVSSGQPGIYTYSPTTVAVPLGTVAESGWLKIESGDGGSYSIDDWSPSNPFNIDSTSSGAQPVDVSKASTQEYSYAAGPGVPKPRPTPPGVGAGGGGHVIIKST